MYISTGSVTNKQSYRTLKYTKQASGNLNSWSPSMLYQTSSPVPKKTWQVTMYILKSHKKSIPNNCCLAATYHLSNIACTIVSIYNHICNKQELCQAKQWNTTFLTLKLRKTAVACPLLLTTDLHCSQTQHKYFVNILVLSEHQESGQSSY